VKGKTLIFSNKLKVKKIKMGSPTRAPSPEGVHKISIFECQNLKKSAKKIAFLPNFP